MSPLWSLTYSYNRNYMKDIWILWCHSLPTAVQRQDWQTNGGHSKIKLWLTVNKNIFTFLGMVSNFVSQFYVNTFWRVWRIPFPPLSNFCLEMPMPISTQWLKFNPSRASILNIFNHHLKQSLFSIFHYQLIASRYFHSP